MFGIQNYGSFIAAVIVFQLIPGPGTLAILNATARHGARSGMSAVVGTLLGDLVYMTAAAAGLASLMQHLPALFQVLQWFGCAYLCWMGWHLLRMPVNAPDAAPPPPQSPWVSMRQALLVSLTNPKVVLFFVAFFPLFMSAQAGTTTLLALMLHVTCISLVYQAGLVLIGNTVAKRLTHLPSVRRWATRAAGLALLAFGVRLAMRQR
jgi:RhtB (resistance to homoserine/threonine) family protein